MNDAIKTIIEVFSKEFSAGEEQDRAKFVLYKTFGVADGRIRIDTPVYVLLAKRNNSPHVVINNWAICGDIDFNELPHCVNYIGPSSFDEAKLILEK